MSLPRTKDKPLPSVLQVVTAVAHNLLSPRAAERRIEAIFAKRMKHAAIVTDNTTTEEKTNEPAPTESTGRPS